MSQLHFCPCIDCALYPEILFKIFGLFFIGLNNYIAKNISFLPTRIWWKNRPISIVSLLKIQKSRILGPIIELRSEFFFFFNLNFKPFFKILKRNFVLKIYQNFNHSFSRFDRLDCFCGVIDFVKTNNLRPFSAC